MKTGFTGTRHELTAAQQRSLESILHPEYGRERWEFHHGACKGADSLAAQIAWGLNYDVFAHPGQSASGGDNEWLCPVALEHSSEVLPTKTHFARNRDIVNETDMLIACPWQTERPAPKTGGGTWYTIEYAEKQGKPVTIIWPNGSVSEIQGRAEGRAQEAPVKDTNG
jgi:hypothetical protein